MDFTVSTWQQAAAKRLGTIGDRPGRWKNRDAPYLLYGALCGLSLWPLVKAAQSSELQPAIVALGSVVGGIGGNLIAEQVQSWKDRSDEVDASEIADWVVDNATTNPELRDALDAILQKLGAIPEVQSALGNSDRLWFTETLRAELAQLGNLARFEPILIGTGAIAHGAGTKAVGERGVVADQVGGSIITGDYVVYAEEGATIVFGGAPPAMTAVDRDSALGRYLHHVIIHNRYLQLQGIRSGGQLVHIELDRIYVTLRATRQRVEQAKEGWLAEEAALARGENHPWREGSPVTSEKVTLSVNEALSAHSRLAVLGDPGSGKTTLLRYLALLYARDLAEGGGLVKGKLGLDESECLPIFLPLRRVGAFLRASADDRTEGHDLLLDFLFRSLKNEDIHLPNDFFDRSLNDGQAVILLDGLDEVADPDLRLRVSRLVEAFTRAYPDCRYVVTSRVVGYTGSARLGEEYKTTTIRDFTMADVGRFLTKWYRLVAVGQMGPGENAETYAADQTDQLLRAIRGNERIRELAINPLMLTVIAMVHRDRVKLPDRRAELYAEAVDVLLSKWEEAKGAEAPPILEDKPFDTSDKRLMLQSVALVMHENHEKEISDRDLRRLLGEMFTFYLDHRREVVRAVARFLSVIQERTGLWTARGEGVVTFSHLTFQEYLAALGVAARDDYLAYTLKRVPDPWWREVILLEAGLLSTQSKQRTTRLIRAISEMKEEPEPYHNLVLAAECLRDVGSHRVDDDLEREVQRRLRRELEVEQPIWSRWLDKFGTFGTRAWIERRGKAMEALVRAGAGYWSPPHGEPEWVQIPAGKFWKGDEDEADQVDLRDYDIARIPVTNAQYYLFVQATGHEPPSHWEEGRPPKGKESHPVVHVTWYDAQAYCQWLSEVTGKSISLPTEGQWEKAARGDGDRRIYPWGDTFDSTRCNSVELGLGDTTPAGIFSSGGSPYGVLDMAGNVCEWTQNVYGDYAVKPGDCRENVEATTPRVVRGGAFSDDETNVRCAARYPDDPNYGNWDLGFRVIVAPGFYSGL